MNGIRIAIDFPRPAGGTFSHFAHFISDFVLPFHSVLTRRQLVEAAAQEAGIVLELKDVNPTRFGPLLPLVHEIFPGVELDYVSRFTLRPARPLRLAWVNNRQDIDGFLQYLKQVLPLKPASFGVVVVRRGLDRNGYPGGNHLLRSGADRRTICGGFDKLLTRIQERRADVICVELEHLAFREQVSLFLSADTLVGQHGAAFVHGHWMPRGGHLIELQCRGHRLCPNMVPRIAGLRNHKFSIVGYPCRTTGGTVGMSIGDATRVSSLLRTKAA